VVERHGAAIAPAKGLQRQEIAMPDDLGMSIEYDELSGTVTVTFRGKKTVLPRTYPRREAGMQAGKDFCRRLGRAG
jgi:hypothetical protein